MNPRPYLWLASKSIPQAYVSPCPSNGRELYRTPSRQADARRSTAERPPNGIFDRICGLTTFTMVFYR